MCLILFAYRVHPTYPLVLAANRDEFYRRPAAPLSVWNECPHILAGRDLEQNGTWLGATRRGRMAALTNFRDPSRRIENAPSRGRLVSDFLKGGGPVGAGLEKTARTGRHCNGFNLIAGDPSQLFYYSNRDKQPPRKLKPGIYGLSNHLLDTPWPKVEKGKKELAALLSGAGLRPDDLFALLSDRTAPSDDRLPDTGVGLKWERRLSPIFITGRTYGTRSSAVVLMGRSGRITFAEKNFDLSGKGDTRTFRYSMPAG